MTALLAAAPALPLHTAVKYVAAAYVVFLAIVLIYVGIMAKRLHQTEQDLVDLRRDLAQSADAAEPPDGDSNGSSADAVESPSGDSIGSSADAELPGVSQR
jgi:hypothetical protein